METDRKHGRTWAAAAVLCAALLPSTAAAATTDAEFVPGEVVVRFSEDTSRAESRQVAAEVDGRLVERVVPLNAAVVDLPPGLSVEGADRLLEREAGVLYAEPNYLHQIETIPSDDRFEELWGLDNTQLPFGGLPDADIDATEAWDTVKGSTAIRVGVVDSGLAVQHPDLAPNVWSNGDDPPGDFNGDMDPDDDGNGVIDDTTGGDFVEEDNTPDDANSHGTHVAGTIGAAGDNGTAGDVVGVNWNVGLMALKAGNAAGSLSSADIAQAFTYARLEGARVVNASFGSSGESGLIKNAIAAAPNVLFVAAAGNSGGDLDPASANSFPCETDLPNVICVAATTPQDALAGFTSYGKVAVDLAAPGTSTLSTVPAFKPPLFSDDLQPPDDFASTWIAGGTPDTWQRVCVRVNGLCPSGADWRLSDSPDVPYQQGADNFVRTATPVDLTVETDCRATFQIFHQLAQGDSVLFEGTTDPVAGPWTELGEWTGSNSGEQATAADLQGFNGQSNVYVRFRLLDNDDGTQSNGVNIDDVKIECSDPAAEAYGFKQGTSMATPHVTGAAALVLAAHPGYTVAQLRNALLSTVDQKSNLSCSVASGGRLNVNNAIQPGAATAPPPPNNCPAAPQTGGDEEPRRCSGKKATIVGTSKGDKIKGTNGPDVIAAGAGADTVTGRGGKDTICGEGGKDRLFGGPGKDQLVGGPAKDLQVQ